MDEDTITNIFSEYGVSIYSRVGNIPRFKEEQDKQIVDLVHRVISPNGIIIDVACGTGTILDALDIEQRIGIDLAQGMIDTATKTTSPDIAYMSGNALSLQFQDEFAEGIICKNALYFLDYKQAFTEWSRVLKQNGYLIFTSLLPNPNWEKLWEIALRDTTTAPLMAYFNSEINQEELIKALEPVKQEVIYQQQIKPLLNPPISLQDLQSALKQTSFSNIKIIDDAHYCATQYLISAQKK